MDFPPLNCRKQFEHKTIVFFRNALFKLLAYSIANTFQKFK